jgi:uncharacterized membrane protein/uncharacterized protein YwbE
MRQRTIWLSSIGVGAATAYLLDPTSGTRRRRRVGDLFVRGANLTGDAAGKVGRDLRNRTRGIVASAGRVVRRDAPDDEVLHERVRSSLGRVTSHPHAIKVTAHDGRVVLTGPILKTEEARVIHAVGAVRGVNAVESRLQPHKEAKDIPSLHGSPSQRRRMTTLDLQQENWAPATRALVGASGVALVAAGLKRRGAAGIGLAVAGAALATRAVTNLELRRLVGVDGRRAVDIQKTITVDVPIDQAFAFWDDFENFPKFMRHVREVRRTNDPRQWHWTVSGPAAAATIEFDAVLTERIPNQVIAWKTRESSLIGHAGLVRFDAINPNRTRIQIRLSYNPPGGALAHGVLALVSADPKSRLDEDLVRMKTVLETGRRPHDAAVER